MASLLRQIVAGPRSRHPEAGLDLCYVTDNIIATSGPTGTYPQLAYRTPLKQLVKFLDEKHGDQWAIWEFRAEGTGYPDDEVYNRIYHYPWPDHHPPPFALIPLITASMRNWLKGDPAEKHVAEPDGNSNGLTPIETGQHLSLSFDSTNLGSPLHIPESVISAQNAEEEEEEEDIPPPPPPKNDVDLESSVSRGSQSAADDSTETGTPSEMSDVGSSPNESGESVPLSERRKKKIVRWRESTLLPPKEDRERMKQVSPTSGSFPKGLKKDKKEKKDKKNKDQPEHKRVVVVHCKAGKGRSGTASCSYLISQEGWTVQAALQRFTERRMRPGFGAGVSIPSQVRWISYVDRWTKGGHKYFERPIEVTELHVWGLRDRVKVSVRGFKNEGKAIEVAHTFSDDEQQTTRGDGPQKGPGFAGIVTDIVQQEMARYDKTKTSGSGFAKSGKEAIDQAVSEESRSTKTKPESLALEGASGDVVFRPQKTARVATNDINIDFERRNKGVSNLSMITSVAHVWFNAYFESEGADSGVFEIEWDRMDGIKGSSRKGTRAFDRLAVVWRAAPDAQARPVEGPAEGEGVRDRAPADWTGVSQGEDERDLGSKVAGSSTVSLEKFGGGERPATAVAVGGERSGTAVAVGGENMF